jgi:uncharacterized protein YndB with AHSA1/START domain
MTTMTSTSDARAVWDFTEGFVLATVEIEATPERVFRAISSDEVCQWWVRPGVFDTREWQGDVRVGGKWSASGIARGNPYTLEGEYLEVDPPRKLVQTWRPVGGPGPAGPVTTVSYVLEPIEKGTRITLRHWGFETRPATEGNGIGWETSFQKLSEVLG